MAESDDTSSGSGGVGHILGGLGQAIAGDVGDILKDIVNVGMIPGEIWTGERTDVPEAAREFALGVTGMGLGLPKVPGAALGMGRRVYHGSPHEFDKFSNEAIGTGQGAQSYGWGHYVAGHPDTALHYQQTLAGEPYWEFHDPEVGINTMRGHMDNLNWAKKLPGAKWSDEDLAKYNAFMQLNMVPGQDINQLINKVRSGGATNAANWIEQNKDRFTLRSPGHFMEIHVKPEEHEFLDWDQSYSDMIPEIKNKLNKVYTDNVEGFPQFYSGEDIYKDLSRKLGGQENTSKALHDAGIPGIKYTDEGSRHLPLDHPDVTRNYVVFDPSNLEIISRNGQRLVPVDYDPFGGETK